MQHTDPTALPTVPSIGDAKAASGKDPCALLHARQLRNLGLPPGGAAGSGTGGPSCTWNSGGKRALTLTLFDGKDGLTTLLHHSDSSTTRVRIEGYPALETFTDAGAYCRYDVGYAAHRAFTVTMSGGEPDSCVALHQAMHDVLANMPTATTG
jgi:hypothetical protein